MWSRGDISTGVLAIAASLVALGCDHTISRTIATLDRTPPIRLIEQRTRISGFAGKGHSGATVVAYDIVIGDRAILRVQDPECTSPLELAADDTSQRVAVRCETGPWTVYYVAATGRAVRWPDRLATPAIDWSALPGDLDAAAPQLYAGAATTALAGFESEDARTILRDVRARRGGPGLAQFLIDVAGVRTAALAPCENHDQTSSWRRAYDSLAARDRAVVNAALVHTVQQPLARAQPANEALRKAVAVLDLDDPALAPSLRVRLAELLDAPELADPLPADVLLRWLALRDPRAAGDLACHAVLSHPAWTPEVWTPLENALMFAIAHGGHACVGLEQQVVRRLCVSSTDWYCGDQLCDRASFASVVTAVAAIPFAQVRVDAECRAVGLESASFLPAALLTDRKDLAPEIRREVARCRADADSHGGTE